MNKKIISILIFLILITTVLPPVISLKNYTINNTILNNTQLSIDGTWIEGQKILASDGASNDIFGIYASLDDDTILIGAPWDDDNGEKSGSAYIFTRSGTSWIQQAKLLASDGTAGAYFGVSVSLDGDTALIGAEEYVSGGKGSAYVFTRSGTIWTQQAKLTASDGVAKANFGVFVSLNEDTALIGACRDDANGFESGSAYVFTRTGDTWIEQQKLTPSDGETLDWFGVGVSVYDDTAIIGAYHDDDMGADSGSAYIFTRSGTSWTQQAKLLASDGVAKDEFGISVVISGDSAIIAAPLDDDKGKDSGSAYVFTLTGDTWAQQQKLIASDGVPGDQFSIWSVSLDGDTAIIGACYDDDKGKDSGSAYVFTRTGSIWTQYQKLTALDGSAGDNFAVGSLDGDTAVMTAWCDDDNGVDSGSVYVFTKNKSPNSPTITGESSGKPGTEYEYTFVSNDPDGDEISYFIDWGDNTNTGWTRTLPSGAYYNSSHIWSEKGEYTIKSKSQDIYGAESEWSTFEVTMPKTHNYNSIIELLLKLSERFLGRNLGSLYNIVNLS